MESTAAYHRSRSIAAAGQHLYVRPSVRPLPRPQVVEPVTW